MSGITLRDGKATMAFDVDVPSGETFTSPESGTTWAVTNMTVSLVAKSGTVSVYYATLGLEDGGVRSTWGPLFDELSRGLRTYLLELDAALRAAPFQP